MRTIIFAMTKEIAPPFDGGEPLENNAGLILRRLSDDLVTCVCGIGKVNAALAAQYVIDRFGATEVWNADVTGCFHDYPAGTLLCAEACVQHDMDTFGDPPGLIPVLVMVVSMAVMVCCGLLMRKPKLKWLSEYALPISLVVGMASAIPFTAWLS